MLTVLIATRNGAKTLPLVLDAFTGLKSPTSGWKLVVVDNGSTDNTGEIVKSFQERLPITYAYEGAPGKNSALNTGLKLIEGDLVVFTDDDVFPRNDWLLRLRAEADARPEFGVFGGAVMPRWETDPPPWIAWTALGPTFAVTSQDLIDGPVHASDIFGPNMAIRADVFRRGTRFDPSIGPRGTSYAMGSETELVRRLLREGHKAWHIRDAMVEHYIRDSQMTQAWIMARAIRFGRGQYRLAYVTSPSKVPVWMGAPRYLYRALLEQGISVVRSWVCANDEDLFCARWRLNFLKGQFIEARILSRDTTDDKKENL